jgi:AcrR family transcriptional regulator
MAAPVPSISGTLPAGASKSARTRVPSAQTREALVEAAVHEFAHGGLHGTPVERIAKAAGVHQPYVFRLFATKRDLFLAAVERCFANTSQLFERAAADFQAGRLPDCEDVLDAIGQAYHEMLFSDQRDWLMMQHQAYAACDDEVVRARVRELFAENLACVQRLAPVEAQRFDDFVAFGMWLNVAAALGVDDLSVPSEWISGD